MSYRSRRGGSTPVPPRAFMGSNEQTIVHAIRRMASEQRWMATRGFTVEDFRQLFVPAQYRHSLQEAFTLSKANYMDENLSVPIPKQFLKADLGNNNDLYANFSWNHTSAPEGFYVPEKITPVVQDDVSPELRERAEYMFENLARISYEFGMVAHVFAKLNINGFCNTPQQMRYVWPAIRHIVDKARISGLDLAEASARAGDRARVPGDIAEFMVPTVHIINRTLLMDVVDMNEKRDHKLAVNEPLYSVTMPEALIGEAKFKGIC